MSQIRRTCAAASAAAIAVGLTACGTVQTAPNEAVLGYSSQLAEGNYSNACTYLDGPTKNAVEHYLGRPMPCPEVFAKCLINQATAMQHDQTQLLDGTVQVTQRGKRATATVNGTPVANAIKAVSLLKEHGHWKLTSYGYELRGCRHRERHRSPKR